MYISSCLCLKSFTLLLSAQQKLSRSTNHSGASYKFSCMLSYNVIICTLITYCQIFVPSHILCLAKNASQTRIVDQQIAAWDCMLVTYAQLCLFKAENCVLHWRTRQLIMFIVICSPMRRFPLIWICLAWILNLSGKYRSFFWTCGILRTIKWKNANYQAKICCLPCACHFSNTLY